MSGNAPKNGVHVNSLLSSWKPYGLITRVGFSRPSRIEAESYLLPKLDASKHEIATLILRSASSLPGERTSPYIGSSQHLRLHASAGVTEK
jgi:hypothetical protein